MKRRTVPSEWLLVLLLGGALSTGALSSGSTWDKRAGSSVVASTDSEEVLRVRYRAVIDQLLPAEESKPSPELKWRVVVRIFPFEEEPEYLFSLQKRYDGRVQLRVVVPRGSAVSAQVRLLLRKDPTLQAEQLTGLLALDEWQITDKEWRGLAALATRFESMRTSAVLPDQVFLHPTGYEIISRSLWGNKLYVLLNGPAPDAPRQPHPFLNWIAALHRLAEIRRQEVSAPK